MSRPRLLLVEDSPDVTFVVRLCARRLGHDLACFEEVAPAWEYLTGLRAAEAGPSALPDLLVLDINLPGENGLELCLRLRSTPGLDRLPVALFGSWDRPDEIADGLRVGIDFVLTKDLLADPEQWGVRLAEILTPPDGRRAALSVCWSAPSDSALRREHGVETLQRALEHAGAPALGPVRPALLRKAVRLAVQACPGRSPDDWRDALTADGARLNPAWPGGSDAAAVAALAEALADQLWCLRDAAAGLAFRNALLAPWSPQPRPPV
jgi:CheY-like chemotaxis protein